MENIKALKDRFISIYKEHITRPGSERLLEWLLSESSDFFCRSGFHQISWSL